MFIVSLFSIFLIHLLALASPGPDFVFISQTAVNHTRKQTLVAIAGVCSAIAIWELLAISGLSFIIDRVPIVYQLLLLLGGGYLFWLGILSVKSSFKTYQLIITPNHQQNHFFLKGLMTNLANPKALAYFGSIFSVAVAHSSHQTIILMFVIVLIESLIWFYLVARLFSTEKIAKWYQKHLRAINFICGLAFIGFGLSLLVQLLKTIL
ncbi:threonine export protein RhtC [Entomomonas moraniae]|uniref:Threonine export protein RhtC n=1 Tax=Entomomonas moraniae TaxID=2213226 RepID=A0A3S9XAT5_9GAMM|nr:threonine export protein RhtC [Entomomonas moraniae]